MKLLWFFMQEEVGGNFIRGGRKGSEIPGIFLNLQKASGRTGRNTSSGQKVRRDCVGSVPVKDFVKLHVKLHMARTDATGPNAHRGYVTGLSGACSCGPPHPRTAGLVLPDVPLF